MMAAIVASCFAAGVEIFTYTLVLMQYKLYGVISSDLPSRHKKFQNLSFRSFKNIGKMLIN